MKMLRQGRLCRAAERWEAECRLEVETIQGGRADHRGATRRQSSQCYGRRRESRNGFEKTAFSRRTNNATRRTEPLKNEKCSGQSAGADETSTKRVFLVVLVLAAADAEDVPSSIAVCLLVVGFLDVDVGRGDGGKQAMKYSPFVRGVSRRAAKQHQTECRRLRWRTGPGRYVRR